MLNGAAGYQVGITKTLAVMPGDVVSAQVYAKYLGTSGGSGNLSGFATALLSAFGLPAPAGGEVGTASAAIQSYGSFIGGGNNPGTSGWPKGWLNILVFDKDYNPIDLAYEQLNSTYVQNVGDPVKRDHGLLSKTVTIKEPGYVYIYVSNEGTVQQEIYFDDMSITHTKGKIVQVDDYYPFGLTYNSCQRENSVNNRWKFQGQEHIDDLNLGWDSFKWRNHMPDIGRFFNVDPLSEKYYYNSVYAFSENMVVSHRELEGLESTISIQGPSPYGQVTTVVRNQQRREEVRKGGDPEEMKKLNRDEAIGASVAGAIILGSVISGTATWGVLVDALVSFVTGEDGSNESPDGFQEPKSEDDKRYQEKDTKNAPEAGSPYDVREKQDENGDTKQVTTYDEHGDRYKQYDFKDSRRGEHEHKYEYSEKYPRPKGRRTTDHKPIDGN